VIKIFTDPSWISVFITILITLSGAVNWIVQHSKRKQITSTLKISRAVLRLDEKIKPNCEITFDKIQAVTSNIYMLTLEIKNTGSEVITVSDYARNTKIGMKFGVSTKILDVRGKKPSHAIVQKGANGVIIDPLDLKPQDAIVLDVLVTDFDGEIVEETDLLGTEQILKVTLPTRPKLINNLFSALILFIIPMCMFFYATSFALNYIFQTTIINDETNQALGISVWAAGLIATLLSIGIIFVIHYVRPVSMYSKQQELKIGKMRKPFTASFFFVFSLPIFFFFRELLMNTVFNFVPMLDQEEALKVDYSVLTGGLITTVLLIFIGFFLGWRLLLREFDAD
jgi:hypothetical protein